MSAIPLLAAALAAVCAACAAWLAAKEASAPKAGERRIGPIARWRETRRCERFSEQLPDALAAMSNALKAGFSISQAIDSVVDLGEEPVSEEFEILQRSLRIGMGMEEALNALAERMRSEDFTLVTAAILASRRSGGNVTEIFARISETVRERMRIERKVRTLTAQGRMQGLVVSAMPVVLGGAMTAIKPEMMIPFFKSAAGMAACAAAAVLTAIGWILIRKISKIDV